MSEKSEPKDGYAAREKAKEDWLHEHKFDRTTIHIGDMMTAAFGGVSEAAMCLRCFAMVPIADMNDATTTIQRHADWHDAGGRP